MTRARRRANRTKARAGELSPARASWRGRLRKYGWILGAPAVALAFWGLGELIVDSWQGHQQQRTIEFFNRRAQSAGDSPKIAVAIALATTRIRDSKPSEVKAALRGIGTEITADLEDAFDTTVLSGEARFASVGGRVAVMEILTDSSAPTWLRDVAEESPDWYLWLGRSYARQRRYSAWLKASQVAEELARRAKNLPKTAEALTDQGACLVHGWLKVAQADSLFSKATAILGTTDRSATALYLLQERTRARIKAGDYTEALRLNDLQLGSLQGSSDYRSQAEAVELRGVILRAEGDLDGGMAELVHARDLAQQWRKAPTAVEASIVDEMGQVEEAYADADSAAMQVHLEKAFEYYRLSLDLSRAIQKDRGVAFESLACGRTLVRLSRTAEALPFLREAVVLYRTSDGIEHYLVRSLYELGSAEAVLANRPQACQCYDEAIRAIEDGAFGYNSQDRDYWLGKVSSARTVQCK